MAENIVMSELTWTEVDEAIKDRPVALVPVGSTEAHGPHLPVSTDTVIAQEIARRGAAKLKEHGISCLILPPVSYTVAELAADFPGTLSLPPDTVAAFLRDLALATSKRFRAIAFINVHLEPKHVECLKKAVEEAKKAGANVCFTDITKKRWAELLGKVFLDAEAGGEEAYFGDPTAASIEDGETAFEGLVEILRVSVMETLGSKA